MRIEVKVKTRTKLEKVERLTELTYAVAVNAVPTDGQANERVIELLAKHFQVAPSKIELFRGAKAKVKIFDIDL